MHGKGLIIDGGCVYQFILILTLKLTSHQPHVLSVFINSTIIQTRVPSPPYLISQVLFYTSFLSTSKPRLPYWAPPPYILKTHVSYRQTLTHHPGSITSRSSLQDHSFNSILSFSGKSTHLHFCCTTWKQIYPQNRQAAASPYSHLDYHCTPPTLQFPATLATDYQST